jgi:hypothetical protein
MPGSRKGGVQYSKLDEAPAPAPSPAPSTVAVAVVVVVVVVAGGAGARHGRWPVDGDGLCRGATPTHTPLALLPLALTPALTRAPRAYLST